MGFPGNFVGLNTRFTVFSLLLYFISQPSHHFKELAVTYAKFYPEIDDLSVSLWNL